MNRTSNLIGLQRVETMCIFLGCIFFAHELWICFLFLEAQKPQGGKIFMFVEQKNLKIVSLVFYCFFFFFLMFYCILYIRSLNLCKRVNKLQRVDDLNEFGYCFFIIIDQERVYIFLLPKFIQLE